MSETRVPRSPAWKTCSNNKGINARKRRAPVEGSNQCNPRYAARHRYPQTDTESAAATVSTGTHHQAHVKNSADSARQVASRSLAGRQATGRNLAAYQIGCKMGRGNYGVVYKAHHSLTESLVAIKCLRADPDGEGVPSTTLREISLLRDLNHPNIIRLREIIPDGQKIFAVFDYAKQDLNAFIREHRTENLGIGRERSKVFLSQLVSALEYCHSNRVMHRDLKPANILVCADGQLKLADFGLARTCAIGCPSAMTHEVVTLWYRAPEILLGAATYTSALDMWSVGCIFSEMLFGKPLFPGQSELGQLFLMFRAVGTPTEKNWPGVKKLPHFQAIFPQWDPRPPEALWPDLDSMCCDVLRRLLQCAPSARITARSLRRHPLFGVNENTTRVFSSDTL